MKSLNKTSIIIFLVCLSIIFLNKGNLESNSNDWIIYQAEDSSLNGVNVAKNTSNYLGKGYVTDFNNPKDFINFKVNVPNKGLYVLKVRYSVPTGRGDKRTRVILNGKDIGEIVLLESESNKFTESTGKIIKLQKGINTIKFLSDWGYYNFDSIKVKLASSKDINSIRNNLVNHNASKEARRLMAFLVDNNGKSIISGQQGLSYVDWIYKATGKKPAIVGFDFKNYSPSLTSHGIASNQVQQAIEWSRAGGIVQFQWHWNAPKDLKEWDKGFYTKFTSFDIEYALDHPKSEEYKLIMRDIDAIAVQLKTLQIAKVPVLFRPLHEAEGGWFWWGAKGPETAKKLYKIMFNRLTYHHKINNLIWIWNSLSPNWYPGDNYVDIVSYDSYPNVGNYGSAKNKYERLISLVRNKKLVTMSENGSIPDPENLIKDKVSWSWFMTWSDFIKTKNSLEHVRKVYNSKNVITLDKLPEFKKY
ncbi:glycosyl hydrolase [Neobacillus mesonae]|uniref:glycosyl hydrolase n=1 Tax=Neobacillus mesonae TaxID=1193713 RepID=UPI00203BD924|nr:glycosyl hydrolase [Neobacillus mesonae]MCM3569371.1 beta-mannanase [Neobacillus mesonae]